MVGLEEWSLSLGYRFYEVAWRHRIRLTARLRRTFSLLDF